jgi:chromosome segregation protein
MRLERLEISGFKSFSDRAELAFDKGVTAIVGPNGCGKSNVADALTWVMGEQSAKSLRGERMEDVIFNGSDARKAGATAEVRLRLTGLPMPVPRAPSEGQEARVVSEFPAGVDRAESDDGLARVSAGNGAPGPSGVDLAEMIAAFTRDVEVTRRLYRSGESEYLIDGEVCRLRDVHELLMDTGLGAKAYAIIEQGKIGMILSSRPTDRRQLIEEAAGITKYKARRRAAELKLDAAQQNLTRIDDIVFEVEKQRGALKRQAAKARRYQRLREELRRWEKVLFARRYRELALAIDATRTRLAQARERESVASAHLAETEAKLGRLRLEQTEADARASAIREEAHGREITISRNQQQLEFDRHQAEALAVRAREIADEIRELALRRDPARIAIEARREAALEAERARDAAGMILSDARSAQASAHTRLEDEEHAVETARQELFAAINAVTALRHGIDHAEAQKMNVAETLSKLDIEALELQREQATVNADREVADAALARAQEAMESTSLDKAVLESELGAARGELDWRTKSVRAREQDLAALEARLASLEELDTSRAGFDDGARMVLVQANGHVGQEGAVADYLEVNGGYDRAVESCLGDLLQHVIVERHDQAAAGLALVREQEAGRCGFVVVDPGSNGFHPPTREPRAGVVPIADVVRISGPHALTIQKVMPEGYIAETFDQAIACARETSAPVATLDGDVFRGPHMVAGGVRNAARGILQSKREIKELRLRVEADSTSLKALINETSGVELAVARAATAIAALQLEQHRQEKAIVGFEASVARAVDDAVRLARKAEVMAFERRQAEEESAALEVRLSEAQISSVRLQDAQNEATARLADVQRRVLDAREAVDDVTRRLADAGAAHAGLLERASALATDVVRLEEGARELEDRLAVRTAEGEQTHQKREELLARIAATERAVDEDIQAIESLRARLRDADEAASALRETVDRQEVTIRDARRALDDIRAQVGELDVTRATAESGLSHLTHACAEAVQASLEEVLAEVEQLEQAGQAEPDAAAIAAEDVDVDADTDADNDADALTGDGSPLGGGTAGPESTGRPLSMTAEEAMTALKAKIDRLGPVNMMAIEQFDELEIRHSFLTTQRQDLVASIAQTLEAIKRIDETSKVRFHDAFAAIQHNFQETFSTLFGGGRAGLTLLDENDPLESGIDIVASPPGKRLQNVQLLSGGEKALTAIALMFAIFKYKPSPFCLLDEIDAPLDDANVSRFVDMLKGMLDRTQFIVITHNRRTMEIADRLYGVTMEEPGVSKLISVQLN